MLIQNKKKPHLQFEISQDEWEGMEERQRAYKILNTEEVKVPQSFMREKITIPKEVKAFKGSDKKAGSSGKNEQTK